jgi:transposase
MAQLRGWGPRGHRLIAKAPHGRWRTLTFLAALRCDRSAAPCVIDGPINGRSVTAWVEQFLVPTLASGDIVVPPRACGASLAGIGSSACWRLMDNRGSHKGTAMRRTIRVAGAKLFFLPSHSPDLNPSGATRLIRSRRDRRLRAAEASRSSPSSSTSCERRLNEPSRRHGDGSQASSTPSLQENAQTTSSMPAMLQSQ